MQPNTYNYDKTNTGDMRKSGFPVGNPGVDRLKGDTEEARASPARPMRRTQASHSEGNHDLYSYYMQFQGYKFICIINGERTRISQDLWEKVTEIGESSLQESASSREIGEGEGKTLLSCFFLVTFC